VQLRYACALTGAQDVGSDTARHYGSLPYPSHRAPERDLQPVVQSLDHPQTQGALAVQQLADAAALPGVQLQMARRQAFPLHAELDRLHWVGWTVGLPDHADSPPVVDTTMVPFDATTPITGAATRRGGRRPNA